jgi:hypothetical protein
MAVGAVVGGGLLVYGTARVTIVPLYYIFLPAIVNIGPDFMYVVNHGRMVEILGTTAVNMV